MQYVFIHGLGQTPSAWDKTLHVMGKSKEALCPDLPALLADGEAVYDNLYRAFCAYCDALSGPLALCGLSLGAILALNYTIGHPERVKSLTLIGGQYKTPWLMLKIQNAVLGSMKDAMFQETGFGKEAFLSLSESMGALNFSRDLKQVACDVLVLCGERDKANRKAAGKLAEKLPHARLETVKGAGHEVNVDAPKELGELLKAYYKKLESGAG